MGISSQFIYFILTVDPSLTLIIPLNHLIFIHRLDQFLSEPPSGESPAGGAVTVFLPCPPPPSLCLSEYWLADVRSCSVEYQCWLTGGGGLRARRLLSIELQFKRPSGQSEVQTVKTGARAPAGSGAGLAPIQGSSFLPIMVMLLTSLQECAGLFHVCCHVSLSDSVSLFLFTVGHFMQWGNLGKGPHFEICCCDEMEI